MKRGKMARKASTRSSGGPPARVKERGLITVDDTPLRKVAAKEFHRAKVKLDKARAEWRRFEEEDRPLFSQWMAMTFGALLTEIRENARVIHERQSLINDVELEMRWGTCRNPRKAYAEVMRRRNSPKPDDDFERATEAARAAAAGGHDARGPGDDEADDPDPFAPFKGMGADCSEEKLRDMFEDFVRSVFGMNPARMGEFEYESMFAAFQANMFGKAPAGGSGGRGTAQEEKPQPRREDTRIKEIYRILARRLHPDLKDSDDAKVSAVWHEVQDAYATRNLDRLEALLALTEVESAGAGRNASLSQLEGALGELKRGLRAIQQSIRGAKRDPAWRFAQNEKRGPLEKRVRFEMEDEVARQRWILEDLKRCLDDWSRPPRSSGKGHKKKVRPAAEWPEPESNTPHPFQAEFTGF